MTNGENTRRPDNDRLHLPSDELSYLSAYLRRLQSIRSVPSAVEFEIQAALPTGQSGNLQPLSRLLLASISLGLTPTQEVGDPWTHIIDESPFLTTEQANIVRAFAGDALATRFQGLPADSLALDQSQKLAFARESGGETLALELSLGAIYAAAIPGQAEPFISYLETASAGS